MGERCSCGASRSVLLLCLLRRDVDVQYVGGAGKGKAVLFVGARV
jgi:hypothetical protein